MSLSYHNNQAIKDSLISRMQKHIEADELMQNATGEGGKGCTVWCALNDRDLHHGYSHDAFPEVLGLPEWLGILTDKIFEGLPEKAAKAFSSKWPKVIPVGVNLAQVKWRFLSWLLEGNIKLVYKLKIEDAKKQQVIEAIQRVKALHDNALLTGSRDESAAESAARGAARSAAWSAAWKIFAKKLIELLKNVA